MASESERQSLRVAPVLIPGDYSLAPPPADSEHADTYRQTRFLLRSDLQLFARAMQWQLQVQRDSYPSRYRSLPLAATSLFWSRSYAALRDAMQLLIVGSYPSIPLLARSVCECIGVQGQLPAEEMDVFESWLENALLPDREHQAIDLNLGRYRAAGILASDEALGAVYRLSSDLAMTPFGGTLFLTAPESNQQRILVAFADQAFHAGFAELMSGWLLRLCERQLHYTLAAGAIFNVSPESIAEAAAIRESIDSLLAEPNRCRAEEIEDGMSERRYLISNFRRAASGAARKLLL